MTLHSRSRFFLVSHCLFLLNLRFSAIILLVLLRLTFSLFSMCRYLTANGLCAVSGGAVTPFPPCEFIRGGREFSQCFVYCEYMTELYSNTQYVYDSETDSFIESLAVKPDLNEWEKNYYVEPPF